MFILSLLAQMNDAQGFFGGVTALMLFFFIVAIVASIFWLWMLVDALVNERQTDQKILWFLVIFFLNVLGAIIYFAVRKTARPRAIP